MGAAELELGFQVGSALQRGAAEWKQIQVQKQQRSELEGLMGLWTQRRAARPQGSQDRQVLGDLVARAQRNRDAQVRNVPTGGVLEDGSPETETVIDTPEGPISFQQLEVLRRKVQQEDVANMMGDLDLLMEIQNRAPANPLVQQWAAGAFATIQQKQQLWVKSLEVQQLETDRLQAELDREEFELEQKKYREAPEREREKKKFETDEGIRQDAARIGAQKGADIELEGLRSTNRREEASATPKPPTETQSKAALFGQRAQLALQELDSIDYDRTAVSAGVNAMLPNVTKPEGLQRIEQAERNFLTSVLRRDSGAQITDSEREDGLKQYFPRAGDKPGTVDQKRRNRVKAVEALKGEAGSAWNTVGQGSAAGGTKTVNGVTYRKVEGGWQRVQ